MSEEPYLIKTTVVTTKMYNPKYGDDKMCKCGHLYYRHFDSYDDMAGVGCKYCDCCDFVEESEQDEI